MEKTKQGKRKEETMVCSNCGLTKREHRSMLFFGKDGKYCHKFKKEISLKEYLKQEVRNSSQS